MTKKPDYYKTPLRSRRDIIAWIIDNTTQRGYDYQSCPFCFNVKCYSLDFSFEHLLALYRDYEGNPTHTHTDVWLDGCREKYEQLGGETSESLWYWAQEHAWANFVEINGSQNDTFNHLWDGTAVDVVYSCRGRSGGWLSLDKFEGYNFNEGDVEDTLMEMDYGTLRHLYQLLVMLVHDVRPEAVKSELEFGAAFHLLVNACGGVPQPHARQLKFAFMEDEVVGELVHA
jgi:hypothetical protein